MERRDGFIVVVIVVVVVIIIIVTSSSSSGCEIEPLNSSGNSVDSAVMSARSLCT
jgi:hypothetical protein